MSRPTAEGRDAPAEPSPTEATRVGGRHGRAEDALPVSVTALLAVVALVPTAGTLLIRLGRNAPVGLPAPVREAAPVVGTLAAVVPALAVLGLAAARDRRAERVALAAVGVFALLGAVDAAAWLPAAAATLVGTAAALAFALDRRLGDRSLAALGRHARPVALAALGTLALAASLLASAGIGTVTLRRVGAALTFAALAALPFVRAVERTTDLALWVVATLAVVLGAASAPFVAGAVVLVAFGAGTVPLALLALGIGGGVATVVAEARRGAAGPAVGAALLLFAGVPATLPRAVAVALGLVVVVREWDADRGDSTPGAVRSTAGGGADA